MRSLDEIAEDYNKNKKRLRTMMVKCDSCDQWMIVDREAHDHPFCVMALCTTCTPDSRSIEPWSSDSAHHVSGRRC